MIKKRGRPVGSKNTKVIKRVNVESFEEALKGWDEKEKQVDFKELCQKLQEALARSYVEAEELERVIAHWRNEVGARDIVIRYLESKIK